MIRSRLMTFALCLFALAGPARAGSLWWSYLAQWDTIPGKTELDLNLVEQAPLADYPYVIIAGTMYQGDPEQGLPLAADLPRLKALQDKTLALVCRKDCIFAGVHTYDGYQKYYLYVKKDTGQAKALKALYLQECKGCKMDVSLREDKRWAVYKQFLFPNAMTRDHYRKELQKIGFLPK